MVTLYTNKSLCEHYAPLLVRLKISKKLLVEAHIWVEDNLFIHKFRTITEKYLPSYHLHTNIPLFCYYRLLQTSSYRRVPIIRFTIIILHAPTYIATMRYDQFSSIIIIIYILSP
jgi:hypothetical protein